jgi:hypothetical protein
MNLKKRLLHIAQKLDESRQYGKTTLLAKITKELGGILLVHNFDEARLLERKHDIVVKSIDVGLDGLTGPFFLDNHGASVLLTRAANKIEALEKEIEELKTGKKTVKSNLDFFKSDLDFSEELLGKDIGFEFDYGDER